MSTSKKASLEYQPKTSISLQYQNDDISSVVLEDVIRVILTKNDVSQKKNVRVVSLHWGAKIRVFVTTVKIHLEYTTL